MEKKNTQSKASNFALKVFIFMLFIGVAAGAYLDFTRYFDHKILPRINIAGTSLGGKTLAEAEPIIVQEMVEFDNQGLKFSYTNNAFNPKLSDLGVKIETKDVAQTAMAFGRQGTLETRIKENYQLLTRGYTAPMIISINQGKINEFIDSIAPKIEVEVLDRKIKKETGEILEEGQDGTSIDKTKLVAAINAKITAGQVGSTIIIPTTTIARAEQQIETIFTPGNYYGRYIDVNLAEQKMILFDDNKVINEYTVSTGKWATPTPIGTRYIQNKNARAWSPKYGLYMPYWNSIGDGYGIHELPEWPGGYKEGEAHLGTPVSHGCIRLGVGPAEFVYNWAPIGTPVYIHR